MSAPTQPYRLSWDLPKLFDSTAGEKVVAVPHRQWPPKWVSYPPPTPVAAPQLQAQARQIQAWTGMSLRSLADVLGTTHPTLAALLSGHATDFARRPEIRRRVADLYAVCERLAPLVDHDRQRLTDLLAETGDEDRRIMELAAAGQPARAYLLALTRLSPPAEDEFPRSVFPAVPGEATVELEN